jgi:hypothetical protein
MQKCPNLFPQPKTSARRLSHFLHKTIQQTNKNITNQTHLKKRLHKQTGDLSDSTTAQTSHSIGWQFVSISAFEWVYSGEDLRGAKYLSIEHTHTQMSGFGVTE